MQSPSCVVSAFRTAFALAAFTDDASHWHPKGSLIVADADRCLAQIFAGMWE
jgi:hypothetical protein